MDLCLDEWTEALDNSSEIDVVYMDLKKNILRLISKFKVYGFTEDIIEWLADFLRGRTQQVRI